MNWLINTWDHLVNLAYTIMVYSGNRLFSGLVVHGAANGFAALFPTLIMEKGVMQIRFGYML